MRLTELLGRARVRASRMLAPGVTEDDVRWCYEHLLLRAPENDQAVRSHLWHPDFRSLAQHMVSTSEFLPNEQAPAPVLGSNPTLDRARFDDVVAAWFDEHPERPDLVEYHRAHVLRLYLIADFVGRLLPDGGRLLDFHAADHLTHAVATLHPSVVQHSVFGVNFELDDYADDHEPGTWDVCVNTEILEHLLFDPAAMIHSINRLLRLDGQLLLSTPNVVSTANQLKALNGRHPSLWSQVRPDANYYDRHNREWTPDEVADLIAANGFEIDELHTRDCYPESARARAGEPHRSALLERLSHSQRGDTIFVLARKTSEPAEPVRPSWLYIDS